MAWTENTLQDAEEELWALAEEYFDSAGVQDKEDRIDQEFRLILHRLVLEAWKAHGVGWSLTRMGIDPEVLKVMKEGVKS